MSVLPWFKRCRHQTGNMLPVAFVVHDSGWQHYGVLCVDGAHYRKWPNENQRVGPFETSAEAMAAVDAELVAMGWHLDEA